MGLRLRGRAHRSDVGGDTARDGTAGLRPTQKAADSLQAAVDGGCLELTQGEHVLAPGNQIVLGQPRQLGQAAVQGGVPGTELEQVVAVAASGGGRPILGGEAVKKGLKPGRYVGHRNRMMSCTPCQPPGYGA